jgi:quercetin dioxygenase-like cupin family protein
MCGIALVATLLGTLLLGSCAGQKNKGITKETLMVSENSWDGNKLPPYPVGQPQITVLRYTIPAGAALDPHFHPIINTAVVLSGELEVIDDRGNRKLLKSGDVLMELVNTVHFGRNTGRKAAEILVFYAGTPGTPLVKPAEPEK